MNVELQGEDVEVDLLLLQRILWYFPGLFAGSSSPGS